MRLLDAMRQGGFIPKESPQKGGVEHDVHDYFSHNHSCDNNPLDIHRYSRLSIPIAQRLAFLVAHLHMRG